MTNEELITLIRQGTDKTANMEKLYRQNLPIIKILAQKMNAPDKTEDLIQEAYFGLARAVDLYDPETGVSFISYLVPCIKGTMYRYLYKSDSVRLPAYLKSIVIRYKKLVSVCEKEKGTQPTDRQICAILDIKQTELDLIRKSLFSFNLRSLDEQIADEDEITLGETVADPDDPIEALIEKETQDKISDDIWNIVDSTLPKTAQIFRLHYQEDKSLPEVSEALNQPCNKVYNDFNNGLRKLRNTAQHKLKSYADIYGIGIRTVSVDTFRNTRMSPTEIAVFRDLGIQ